MLKKISRFRSLDLNAQTCKALLNLTSYNFSKVAFLRLRNKRLVEQLGSITIKQCLKIGFLRREEGIRVISNFTRPQFRLTCLVSRAPIQINDNRFTCSSSLVCMENKIDEKVKNIWHVSIESILELAQTQLIEINVSAWHTLIKLSDNNYIHRSAFVFVLTPRQRELGTRNRKYQLLWKNTCFELGITKTKDSNFLPIYPILEISWIGFE